MVKEVYLGDGVAVGFGTIEGRMVCVFAQDFTVIGGSLSETMSEKICKVTFDLAKRRHTSFTSQSIPDRHNALKKIINTMPDMEVPKYKGCKEWNSLKELLNRYIEMQNKYLSLFEKKEANSIYTYNIRYSTVHFDFATLDEIDGRYWINSNIFVPDLDSCKKIAKKEFPKNEGVGFNIGKIYLGNKYYICVEYNNLGQPIQLDIKLPVKDENNGNLSFDTPVIETDDMEIINNPLFFIRYNIPLPFKKGDILCDCFEREPFVLMGMYP